MGSVDDMAVEAAENSIILEAFVKEETHFILRCASKTVHKFITVNDDEWSVSLIAFHDAVRAYSREKGSFLSFAELKINHALIDEFRKQKKFSQEIAVDPVVFSEHQEEETEYAGEIRNRTAYQVDTSIQDEIQAAEAVFSEFGFRFYGLTECSPKAARTRNACREVVLLLLNDGQLRAELYQTKQLPIKKIQKNSDVPRKILENYRKYIIAAVEILNGDYPKLSEYLAFIRKGGK